MSMSRKDYREAAQIIKDGLNAHGGLPSQDRRDALTEVANELASMFQRDNGRFDRYKFLAACGLE